MKWARPGRLANNTSVVIALAALLGILPVLSPLHRAFSSHRHRFDPVSQRYEDVLVEDDTAAGEDYSPPSDHEVVFSRKSTPDSVIIPCLISNSILNEADRQSPTPAPMRLSESPPVSRQ